MQQTQKHIVFVDGDCILCNRAVLYLDRMDSKSALHYAYLKSVTAKNSIDTHYIKEKHTIVYKTGNRIYIKSEAVLKILETINGPRLFQMIIRYTPKKFANLIYDLIANRRLSISSNMKMCNFDENLNSRLLK